MQCRSNLNHLFAFLLRSPPYPADGALSLTLEVVIIITKTTDIGTWEETITTTNVGKEGAVKITGG
jgi:hypothetical protein